MNAKKWVVSLISIVLIADLAILLNIPVLRQVLGFLCFMIIPGILIIQILRLNKIVFTEWFVLSVGLNISVLMFFGLLINNSSLSLGYEKPLATIPLLISFNLVFVLLAFATYTLNKDAVFSLPNLKLSTLEKVFLTAPVLFPALSIFGTHLMKTTDNNLILMVLLFLISAYIVFVCFLNQKFPKRLYPVVIFLISISLLLIFMLRFPHICGHDVHTEYYLFQMAQKSLQWRIVEYHPYDACLSISLLPTIVQSILNINAQEYLFKGVYVSICSFAPVAIYVTSKKYIGELYAFIASFFFISQDIFLRTAASPRTNIAIFFVALAIMVFFDDEIDPLKRRLLFILFIASCVISHYSTTYLFFFILFFSWFATELLSRRYVFKRGISLTIVILFFALFFFWYSQVTGVAFNAGVDFIKGTFSNLNNFFIEELRSPQFKPLFGQELAYPILSRVNWVVTWCTFICIGIGVLTMFRRYKEMIAISTIKHKKLDFLKTKFEVEYLVMVLVCAGLLAIMIALPYVSVGYDIQRLYSLVIVLLSVCFIIGSVTLSKNLSFINNALSRKGKERGGENAEFQAYLIILVILVPYFLFVTGAMYQICGAPIAYTLNSKGVGYDTEYIHDQESYVAKWLEENRVVDFRINTADYHGKRKLISQGGIPPAQISYYYFFNHRKIEGYTYLSYNNVVNGKLAEKNELYNMSEYSDAFIDKSKIYNNGGSEVWT